MAKKGRSKKGRGTTPSQRKNDMERKRDERAQRNLLKKHPGDKNCNKDGDFKSFNSQLHAQGFELRDVAGDGALADQLNGDENMHGKHRKEAVEYMRRNKDDFAPFLVETVTFEKYLQNLSSFGTFGGNDSIVAFARYNKADVIIHQFNNPTFVINGSDGTNEQRSVQIHLAYHSYQHYSSVRKLEGGYRRSGEYKTSDTGGEVTTNLRNKHRKKGGHDDSNSDSDNVGCVGESNANVEVEEIIVDNGDSINSNLNNSIFTEKEDESVVEETVQKLQIKTGYQDADYIRKCLVENKMNQDATLCYILQLLSLNETDKEKPTSEKRLEEVKDDSESNESTLICSTKLDVLSDDVSPVKNNNTSKASVDTVNCSCKEKEGTITDKGSAQKKTQKAKQRHLSNRQRKELAKQNRKKRREETKRSDTTHNPSVEKTSSVVNTSSVAQISPVTKTYLPRIKI
ncbi:OTU domain-containing protein 3-like isoform X2 [Hydractinia symbiolongicarpus]|uniref:OTU domain-containing protein 3-like isoform X2 n=1 Tax=Hydractinia symbiolongicarpus TaxID=13093 RepID=UPI00254E3C70|nr:OTU domain-containing protein 3-like isoform X2 [Hydractinia symbiolongicarpus]